jgi:hypothetical protein
MGAPLLRNPFSFAGVEKGIYCGQERRTNESEVSGMRGGTLNLVIAVLVIILIVILILQFV